VVGVTDAPYWLHGTPYDLEHFRARVLQDAMNEAFAPYWRRRAEWFDTCNPTIAQACRFKAAMVELLQRDADPAATDAFRAEVLDALATLHREAGGPHG
jgi:hypothetical protein